MNAFGHGTYERTHVATRTGPTLWSEVLIAGRLWAKGRLSYRPIMDTRRIVDILYPATPIRCCDAPGDIKNESVRSRDPSTFWQSPFGWVREVAPPRHKLTGSVYSSRDLRMLNLCISKAMVTCAIFACKYFWFRAGFSAVNQYFQHVWSVCISCMQKLHAIVAHVTIA